jgi:hypothetical protein
MLVFMHNLFKICCLLHLLTLSIMNVSLLYLTTYLIASVRRYQCLFIPEVWFRFIFPKIQQFVSSKHHIVLSFLFILI